jgi:hypothetical protein
MSDILLGGESRPVIGVPPSVCRHQKMHLVWTGVGNGAAPMPRRQLRYQCLICGRLSREQVRHALAAPDTPEVDLELLKRSDARWTNGGRSTPRNASGNTRNGGNGTPSICKPMHGASAVVAFLNAPLASARAAGKSQQPKSIT